MHNDRSTSPEPQSMLSLDDVAQLLGIAKRTLHTWRASGELPKPDLKIGKTVRWRRTTIENWISSLVV